MKRPALPLSDKLSPNTTRAVNGGGDADSALTGAPASRPEKRAALRARRLGSGKVVPVAAPGHGAVSALGWNATGTHLAFGTETGFAGVVDLARR